MTQQTNYQLPVHELYQAGTFFANLGLECPWVGDNAWCDLSNTTLNGRIRRKARSGSPGLDPKHGYITYCPPAVAAAVVWYAGELRAWLLWRHNTHSEPVDFNSNDKDQVKARIPTSGEPFRRAVCWLACDVLGVGNDTE